MRVVLSYEGFFVIKKGNEGVYGRVAMRLRLTDI